MGPVHKPAAFVAYYRVSTQRQAASGLGLEAQREAVARLAEKRGANILCEYTEIESGKNNVRPQLAKALHHTQITGATLVIAKLDRLSRNASFLLTLQDSGVKFMCSDMPEANHLTIGILALVAQQEREAISIRTREALDAAKRRGVKLGNPNGASALRRAQKGHEASIARIKDRADAHALPLRSVVDDLMKGGCRSHAALARELNARRILSPRGGSWHKASVRNLLARLAASPTTMAAPKFELSTA